MSEGDPLDDSQNVDIKARLVKQWAAVAEDWIAYVGYGQTEHRDGLLDSWMLRAVGEVSGTRVIDLGCGEGRFSRMLARRGARVTGVDLCPPLIEHADTHRFGDEEYLLGDMADLDGVPDAAFDIAISYVTLVDVWHLDRAIDEAFRVLAPGGGFIVCNLHPMVTATMAPWVKDADGRRLYKKLDNYFDEGPRPIELWAHELTNFHRTISTHVNAFLRAGFTLQSIEEPMPSAEQVEAFPKIADNLRVPEFILYSLRKPSDQDSSN